MDVLEHLAYHAAMFYGLATVAAEWAWGRRRGTSDFALMAFGVAVPAAGWLFSLDPNRSWTAWAAPLCYGFLWRTASEREKVDDRALDEMDDADFARTAARVSAAPDDGAAQLALARMLESKGRPAEAMLRYEAAHRASDRMFTADDLADARERLERAQAAPHGREGAAPRPSDWAVMAVGAVLLVWSPPRGAAVLSATAFARWLRAGPPPRSF